MASQPVGECQTDQVGRVLPLGTKGASYIRCDDADLRTPGGRDPGVLLLQHRRKVGSGDQFQVVTDDPHDRRPRFQVGVGYRIVPEGRLGPGHGLCRRRIPVPAISPECPGDIARGACVNVVFHRAGLVDGDSVG